MMVKQGCCLQQDNRIAKGKRDGTVAAETLAVTGFAGHSSPSRPLPVQTSAPLQNQISRSDFKHIRSDPDT
ncbi:hypothetical protein GbCGDNIH2_8126 [Granulibacter bethesdensis]|nr:hypothetical protein GbCGDNIH2_8126 [Granulibacter bethesdensis]